MIDIKGFAELGNYVASLSTTLRPQIQETVVEIMEPETSKIQKDAPYRTGKLRRSHKFVLGGGKGILCQIRIEAGHAGFVNFGTYRMRPRPFATNGYNRIKSKLRQRLARS
jgi:HK97 gp10 family phage protein